MSRRRKNRRDPIYCVRQFIEGYYMPLNPCASVHCCRNTRDFPLISARIHLNELTDAINWVPTRMVIHFLKETTNMATYVLVFGKLHRLEDQEAFEATFEQ